MIGWLASYPKSGNTWMRMLLANYFAETDAPHDINTRGVTNSIASSRWLFDSNLGVQSSDLRAEENDCIRPFLYHRLVAHDPAPFWMKVHDAQRRLPDGRWLFPPEASAAVIYLIRDPRDVAVSYAFHNGHGDMERAVAQLADPAHTIGRPWHDQLPQYLGSWSVHVASWVDQGEIPVCVVRYEDMLADTPRELARVIAAVRPDVPLSPERLARAVDHARFDRLAAAETESGFREKPPKAERFFRKGEAGDWRNHLTPAQAGRIVADHLVTMRRFGYAGETIETGDPA